MLLSHRAVLDLSPITLTKQSKAHNSSDNIRANILSNKPASIRYLQMFLVDFAGNHGATRLSNSIEFVISFLGGRLGDNQANPRVIYEPRH